jgi:hypothetical protein
MTHAMSHLIDVGMKLGEWVAVLMMRNPELSCVVMAAFLIGVAIHTGSKAWRT